MSKMTQDDRLLSISTPLEKDFVMLKSLSVTEGMSQLYKIHVELVHEEDEDGKHPTSVDIQQLIGETITITVGQKDGGERIFSGIINEFSQGNRNTRFSFYFATIVPSIWILTQNVQSRIFQQKSVPDILKEVFAGFEVSYEMTGTFNKRNYCVQYRETDFDFASRLMEEEGIYYYFEHKDNKHKLIIANTSMSHQDCPSKNEIPFLEVPGEERWTSVIKSWHTENRLQTGKVTFWDHNFQLPTNKLDVSQPSRFSIGGNQKLEIYEYHGGYARKYDGINKSGGDDPSELNKVFDDKTKTAQLRMEALDAQYKVAYGVSDCSTLTAGHRFKMSTHPNKEFNGQYVVIAVQHEAEQTPNYTSNNEESRSYETSFTCIPHGGGSPTFRPITKTPKPIIYGSQTALVVGPAGEEIFTDKYGRVKVQFYWDREGKNNESSSCWVRVAQGWAGNKWGIMFIPRIGMEVIVNFLEGDPDQPIIVGCVYNPETMPPYKLPDEKTKSTIKTNSSKGGGGFNEIRFEDKKGSEQIFMHGEKDLDIRIKNDAKEIIKHDRHLIVENDQYEKVKKDKHLHVLSNHNEEIGAAMSLKVGTNTDIKTGQKYAVDAGMEVHIKAGMKVIVEGGAQVSLKVGGSFVDINPSGVTISGPMVMINSGGSAGSGSGASPEAPKDPKEADTANPGDKIPTPGATPPKQATSYSQKAMALKNAARKRKPLVA